MTPFRLRFARHLLTRGGIVAYPTEAVYGLGCDPNNPAAVERLLVLKGRPAAKGLILVADTAERVWPLLQPLDPDVRRRVEASWPGPVTWLLPAGGRTPDWITGGRDTVAVRVSAHPVVAALCREWGAALVSTSANLTGRLPARTPLAVRRVFGAGVDLVLHGDLGGADRPTEIRRVDGSVLRPG